MPVERVRTVCPVFRIPDTGPAKCGFRKVVSFMPVERVRTVSRIPDTGPAKCGFRKVVWRVMNIQVKPDSNCDAKLRNWYRCAPLQTKNLPVVFDNLSVSASCLKILFSRFIYAFCVRSPVWQTYIDLLFAFLCSPSSLTILLRHFIYIFHVRSPVLKSYIEV